MEAASGANPDKALAISMMRCMLYKNEAPPVAYMHLNEWHKAGSHSVSEDRITSSKPLFVNPLEVSSVLLMALQHPVLLDMASREMLEVSEEPPAPVQLRGFRLHTFWS